MLHAVVGTRVEPLHYLCTVVASAVSYENSQATVVAPGNACRSFEELVHVAKQNKRAFSAKHAHAWKRGAYVLAEDRDVLYDMYVKWQQNCLPATPEVVSNKLQYLHTCFPKLFSSQHAVDSDLSDTWLFPIIKNVPQAFASQKSLSYVLLPLSSSSKPCVTDDSVIHLRRLVQRNLSLHIVYDPCNEKSCKELRGCMLFWAIVNPRLLPVRLIPVPNAQHVTFRTMMLGTPYAKKAFLRALTVVVAANNRQQRQKRGSPLSLDLGLPSTCRYIRSVTSLLQEGIRNNKELDTSTLLEKVIPSMLQVISKQPTGCYLWHVSMNALQALLYMVDSVDCPEPDRHLLCKLIALGNTVSTVPRRFVADDETSFHRLTESYPPPS